MEHYVKRTRAECFDADGFYRTGDLGSYDDDGYVYFGGRRTEMIKTGGRQRRRRPRSRSSCSAYEPIKLARVIGVPDERRDEIVVLCVELKDGAIDLGGGHHVVPPRTARELQGAAAASCSSTEDEIPHERQRHQGAGTTRCSRSCRSE